MSDINNTLDNLYSLPPMECYDTVLIIASQIKGNLKRDKNPETIALGKKTMEKIHGVRYLMSSNKATDRSDFDKKLEEAYQALESLIQST